MQKGMFHHGEGGVVGHHRTMTISFGDGLNVPSTGTKSYLPRCCIRGTLLNWSIVADASGSATIDVQKAIGNSSPTFASMVGSGTPPTLSSVQANINNALIGWKDSSFVETDMLMFNLLTVTTCKKITLTIEYKID